MINIHHYSYRDITEKVDDIKGGTITDIQILDGGKVCIFIEKGSREYTLDCTGERAVVHASLTLKEEVEYLNELLSAVITLTGISEDKLMEIISD